MSISSEIDRITGEVSTQKTLISRIAQALEGKAAGGGSSKPEQEKAVEINENGTTEIVPDEGYALSKVGVTVNVEGSDATIKNVVERSFVDATIPNGVTAIGYYAFARCTSLKNVTMPDSIEEIRSYGFFGCAALNSIELPDSIRNIADYAFANCHTLTSINMPASLETLVTCSFLGCYALKRVTFGAQTLVSIAANAFANCASLDTVIIRYNGVVTLAAANALGNTAVAKSNGFIYVPAALVDSYKAASNWSTYAAQFRAIEDYPDICGEV